MKVKCNICPPINVHALSLVIAILIPSSLISCKKIFKNSSSQKDLATSSSFKTGFFMPKLKQEYSARKVLSQSALTPSQFVEKIRKILNKNPNQFSLLKPEGSEYAVTVSSSGEQILLLLSKDIPLPLYSIDKSTVFKWYQHAITKDKSVGFSEIFVKGQWSGEQKQTPAMEPQNMYVRRVAVNNSGYSEAVLVPWLNHVESESTTGSKLIVFRIGNTIINAANGRPAIEFKKVGNDSSGPAWVVVGPYDDGEVKGGTVFWKAADKIYYSQTPGSKNIISWKTQDGDSIDKVKVVSAKDVKTPNLVVNYLNTLPTSKDRGHPANITVSGFDWLEGDSGIIQLDNNDLALKGVTLTSKSSPGLSLDSNDTNIEKSEFLPSDFVQNLNLEEQTFSQWWSGEKPTSPVAVQNVSGGDIPYQVAKYTDQTGNQKAGMVLSKYNNADGESTYQILNRTNNTVQEVTQEGRTVGSEVNLEDFKAREMGTLNRWQTRQGSGEVSQSDARAMKEANSLDERSTRQLERVNSLVGEGEAADMAKTLGGRAGVDVVSNGISSSLPGGAKSQVFGNVANYEAARIIKDGTPTGSQGLIDHGAAMTFDGVGGGAGMIIAPNNTAVNNAVQGVAGVGSMANDRYKQGDFNTLNPDYDFDSKVSGAAIFGEGVNTAVRYSVEKQIQTTSGGYIPPAAQAATGQAVKSTVGAANSSAEALSRANYAGTLSQEAGEVLNQQIEQRQRATGAEESIKNINQLDSMEQKSTQP